MLTEEELKNEILTLVKAAGAKGPSDMGRVMGMATKALAGKAEGKAIADMVKSILASL